MELKTAKKKELRGHILIFLNTINPESISRESIMQTFFEYWEYDDLMQALQYLVDGGYAEEKKLPSPFGTAFDKLHSYKITKKGVDLCDLTISDDGVFVRR